MGREGGGIDHFNYLPGGHVPKALASSAKYFKFYRQYRHTDLEEKSHG